MTSNQKKKALKIKSVLNSQSFSEFYTGIFMDNVTGEFERDSDEDAKNKKEVLEWIVDHFELAK